MMEDPDKSSLESAIASISIYANTVWWSDYSDPYKMANLRLWQEVRDSWVQVCHEQPQHVSRTEDPCDPALPDPSTWIRVQGTTGQQRTHLAPESINETSSQFKIQTVEELKLLRKTSRESVKNIWLKPEPEQRKKDLPLNANVPEFYPPVLFHHPMPLETYQPINSHVYQTEIVPFPEQHPEIETQWRQPQIPVFCRPSTTNVPDWYCRSGTSAFPNVVLLQRTQRTQSMRGGLQPGVQVLPGPPPRVSPFILPAFYPQQLVTVGADYPELPSGEKTAGGEVHYPANESLSAARTLEGLARRVSRIQDPARLANSQLQDSSTSPSEEDSQTAIEGKFEELEREALEQYISSEDSEAIVGRNIENDDPYQVLEREAEEQYDDHSEQEIKASVAKESSVVKEGLAAGANEAKVNLEDGFPTLGENDNTAQGSSSNIPVAVEVKRREQQTCGGTSVRHKRNRSCIEDVHIAALHDRQDVYPLPKVGKINKEDTPDISYQNHQKAHGNFITTTESLNKPLTRSSEPATSNPITLPSDSRHEKPRKEGNIFGVSEVKPAGNLDRPKSSLRLDKEPDAARRDAKLPVESQRGLLRKDEASSQRGREVKTASVVSQSPGTSQRQRRQKNRQAKLALDGPSGHITSSRGFLCPPDKNVQTEIGSETAEHQRTKLSKSSIETEQKSNKFPKENKKSFRLQSTRPLESYECVPREIDTKTLLSRLKIRALHYLKTVDMKLIMEEKQVVRELLYRDDKGKEKIRNRVRISDITQTDVFRSYAKEISTLAKLSTEVIYRRIRREVLEMKTVHIVQPSTAEKRKVRHLIKRCLQLKGKAEELMSKRKLPKKQFESLRKEVADILNTIHKTMEVVYSLRKMCQDCADQLECGKSLLADLALGRELPEQDKTRALREYGPLLLFLASTRRPSGLLLDRVMARLQRPGHMYATHNDLLRNNLLLARYHDNNSFGVVQIRFISTLRSGGPSAKDVVWEEKNWSRELQVGNSVFPVSLELEGFTDYFCDPDAARKRKVQSYLEEYYNGEPSQQEPQPEIESKEEQNER